MVSFVVLAALVVGVLFMALWLVVSSAVTLLVGPKQRGARERAPLRLERSP